MLHAILIMAHKDAAHVYRIAKHFSMDCDVYVHFDRRNELDEADLTALHSLPQVKKVLRTHAVNWGGTSVLECELNLLEVAVNNSNARYFHLISGQDYPIRSLNDFLKYFEDNDGIEFLQYTHLPHKRWEDNSYRRFEYYYPYDWAEGHENPRRWVMERVREQMRLGLKRPLPTEFDHLYGGSQWFSITRTAAETLLNYTHTQPSLYRRMWMTFAPEESYVATVLLNLTDKENVRSTNLRYIRWHYENGNRPANLGSEHFADLVRCNCFFARKFERGVSEKLLNSIDTYLLKDTSIKLMPCGGRDYDGVLSYGYDEAFSNFVLQFCQELGITSAVDMGCGSGVYVSQWREFGLPFEGYDANPHTARLSQLLMPQSQSVCGIYDLAGEETLGKTFELVVCKEVLPYIPRERMRMAAANLSRQSSHFIILLWGRSEEVPCNDIAENEMIGMFSKDFEVENYMTARLRVMLMRKDCCVLIRKGKQILDGLA